MTRMIRRAGCVLAAGLALAAPFTLLRAAGHAEAQPMFARGEAALAKGDARTARVEYMNAIKADPRWAAPRLAQARALLALGDGLGAGAELDRAAALGTPADAMRTARAQSLLLQGRADEALNELAKGVPAGQRAAAAQIAGRAHQATGDLAAAQADFDRALALAPKDPALWVDVSRYRLANGDRVGALTASDRAMALGPRSIAAIDLRALLIRDQYGPVAALAWFQRGYEVDPDNVPLLVDYAATLADSGQARRALSLTRRALALDPGNARAFFTQAVIAARAGKAVLATRLLAHTGGALDGEPATMLLRGALHIVGGNATLAAQDLEPLVEMQPMNVRARTLLGRAYYDAGQFADCVTVLDPIVARADADSYALILYGRAQEASGNRAAADEALARATRPVRGEAVPFAAGGSAQALAGAALADAGAAFPNIAYIRALLNEGDAQAAVARAAALAKAHPGAPAAQMILGDTLAAAGRTGEAIRAYESAANVQFTEDVALRLIASWRAAGQPERAAQTLSLYITQNPAASDAGRVAATTWMLARQWDKATAALEALRARTGNNDALLMADLGWAWAGRGAMGKAVAYAAHGYRLQPASPVTSDAYGWMLLKSGQRRDAIDLLEKAQALAPGNRSVAEHLRQALAGSARGAG